MAAAMASHVRNDVRSLMAKWAIKAAVIGVAATITTALATVVDVMARMKKPVLAVCRNPDIKTGQPLAKPTVIREVPLRIRTSPNMAIAKNMPSQNAIVQGPSSVNLMPSESEADEQRATRDEDDSYLI